MWILVAYLKAEQLHLNPRRGSSNETIVVHWQLLNGVQTHPRHHLGLNDTLSATAPPDSYAMKPACAACKQLQQ